MQHSFILFVFSAFLIKSGYGCAPCKCYKNTEDPWNSLQLGECKKELKLTEIPATLHQDIEALSFEWQTLSHIPENQFIKFTKVQILYLRNNKLKYVAEHAFKNLISLKIVSLSENEIMNLPTDLLQDTPNLTTFWMNNNNITKLQKNLFSNLPYLRNVYINRSNVTIIEEGCFSNLPVLETLELKYNRLKTLQLNDLKTLLNLKINENPWKCEETCDLIHTVLTNKNINIDEPTCESPRQVKGKQWKQLTVQDFVPSVALDANVEDGETNFILHCTHCLAKEFTWAFYRDLYAYINTSNPLILNNLKEKNNGEYTCAVQDCVECDTASVRLNVMYSPKKVTQLTEEITTEMEEHLSENIVKNLDCTCMNWKIIIIIAVITVVIIIIALTLILCYYRNKNNEFQIYNEELNGKL